MKILKHLNAPPMAYRPDVRWWLAEGFHTDQTLKNDIQMLFETGFGAIEFLAMDEHGADSSKYGWGSEEWVHDTHTIIREATDKSMGASFTSGTNWSNANLPDFVHLPDDRSAAKEIVYTVEYMMGGQTREGAFSVPVPKSQAVKTVDLIAVVAIEKAGMDGKKTLLKPRTAIVLTDSVKDGALSWTAPEGEWTLFAFYMHGTGQTASPSVSVSYTVNYMDPDGIALLTEYWDKEVLTESLRSMIKENGRIQMYMDSLELSTTGNGGQLWGYGLIDVFKDRRGYDIVPLLPFIVKDNPMMGGLREFQYHFEPADNKGYVVKLRNDLYQTMTECYIEYVLEPMQRWLHARGMELRAEISYGLPFEITLPGKYVDGIETESLEFGSQIEPYRQLAGPAHLFDKIYSSETGATVMNYQMGLSFYTQIIYTQFAAGVTKTVLHGYSSIAGAEGSTYWPGHEGMWPLFSERFGSRQPAYQHYQEWTVMVARNQMILRQGKPRMDLAILRLDYTFNNMYFGGGGERDLYEKQLMRGHKGVYWQDMSLQDAGYTYDYFAPQLLEDPDVHFADGLIQPNGPGYQALIIYQEGLPLTSAKLILDWARQGMKVVLVNHVTEQIRAKASYTHDQAASKTPFNNEDDQALATVIAALKALPNVAVVDDQANTKQALIDLGVVPRSQFVEPNEHILTCLREDGDSCYLFVYNYMYPMDVPTTISIRIAASGKPYVVDCWAGTVSDIACCACDKDSTTVTLTLMPGESKIIALDGDAAASESCAVVTNADLPEAIDLKDWTLKVEDWDEGDKKTIVEDRGLGIVTNEIYYETKKTMIDVGATPLIPWKEIPAVGDKVSGVGYYQTKFTLPDDWACGANLVIESTNGNSAAVYVNGQKAGGYDFDRRSIDISNLLKPGKNELLIEVSSTLNNRLIARNYFDVIVAMLKGMAAHGDGPPPTEDGPAFDFAGLQMKVQDYGLTGSVKIVPHAMAKVR